MATAPTLSLSTDSDTYAVGDTITVTAEYSDATSAPVTLTISGTFQDTSGRSVNATTNVTVATEEQEPMTGTITDSWGDDYTQLDNVAGVAHFSATLVQPIATPAGR
jgi:hypothetical protein